MEGAIAAGVCERPCGHFRFAAVIKGSPFVDFVRAEFREANGLDAEINIAKYREGNGQHNRPTKVPGKYNLRNVTLKWGVFDTDDSDDICFGTTVLEECTHRAAYCGPSGSTRTGDRSSES
jgi:hypothetical protein